MKTTVALTIEIVNNKILVRGNQSAVYTFDPMLSKYISKRNQIKLNHIGKIDKVWSIINTEENNISLDNTIRDLQDESIEKLISFNYLIVDNRFN